MQNILVSLQEDYDFLSFSHSQSNQESAHSLAKAYRNYLDPKMKNFSKPKFKKKHKLQSFYIPNQNNIMIKHLDKNDKLLSNPIVNIKPFIRLLKHSLNKNNIEYNNDLLLNLSNIYLKHKLPKEMIENDIKITGITISFDKYDNYFISINYKYNKVINQSIELKDIIDLVLNNKSIGIDIGLKNKVNDNIGKKFKSIIDNKSYKQLDQKKRQLQKDLSKKVEVMIIDLTIKNGKEFMMI
ncbi:MAG: hypothetical protein U9N59_06440 [Campylobacterota bacterium]|nr:hypothetical protein [Campylobacterota bacterium]